MHQPQVVGAFMCGKQGVEPDVVAEVAGTGLEVDCLAMPEVQRVALGSLIVGQWPLTTDHRPQATGHCYQQVGRFVL